MSIDSCPRCGGAMIGDGYMSVRHCEFAEEELYQYHEPDARPVFCDFDDVDNDTEEDTIV